MARIIKVTPEQLEGAAKNISKLAGGYQSLYIALYNKADAMESQWSGEDNIAFIERIKGFREDFDAMYRLMEDYAGFLVRSATSYKDAQRTIIEQTKSLKN